MRVIYQNLHNFKMPRAQSSYNLLSLCEKVKYSEDAVSFLRDHEILQKKVNVYQMFARVE